MTWPRLTQTAKRAGCAAKQPPGALFPLLERLPKATDPNLLIGSATADDAAVYRLDDERALVLTTDFFTPIVDDPYDFGAVAAANALSDVYAMGGRPISALNIVGFPDGALAPEVLVEILRGGAEKAREAGIDIAGGHSIVSEEPIYGLSVTGLVHPARVWSNAGARPGDRLILTKPLGVGIVATAAKQDKDHLGAIGLATRLMARLNRDACEVGQGFGAAIHAATDITGYGLLGHLRNVLLASGVSATVDLERVPFLDAARAYVAEGIAPGGTRANARFLDEFVNYSGRSADARLLLCDAQTSGGLLFAVAPDQAEALAAALAARGTAAAAIIGSVHAPGPALMTIR
ncbi:MAG: selenide, water dikinase SelD [Myxococcota bacterium]